MEEEINLDLRDVVHVIRVRMKMIVIITLACTLLAGLVSFYVLKPVYQVQTSMIVGKPQTTNATQTQYNDALLYQKLLETYVEIAQSRIVAVQANKELDNKYNVEDIQKIVTVTPQTDTQVLLIKVQNQDPAEAVKICNAVSKAFIEQSKVVFPTGGDIQIMDVAEFPQSPVKPNKAKNLALAFLIGLIGSIGLAFVLDIMDRSIKSEEEIARYLDIPVIGVIPREVG